MLQGSGNYETQIADKTIQIIGEFQQADSKHAYIQLYSKHTDPHASKDGERWVYVTVVTIGPRGGEHTTAADMPYAIFQELALHIFKQDAEWNPY